MRTGRAWAIVVLALFVGACTSAGQSATTTSAANPKWYPPIVGTGIPRDTGCVGRQPTGLTTAEATQLFDKVDKLAAGALQSTASCPGGPALIGLRPGEEQLANQLLARYGKNVAITVGFMPYDGRPVRSPTCGDVAASSPLPPGVQLSLVLHEAMVPSGSFFEATVVVSDSGPRPFEMDTGQPLVAVVVRPATRHVVGVYSGGIAGTGQAVSLKAGESGTIAVLGGTARCDGGIGSALPPGTYQVLVQVSPEGRVHTPNYVTPPVPLVVTAS